MSGAQRCRVANRCGCNKHSTPACLLLTQKQDCKSSRDCLDRCACRGPAPNQQLHHSTWLAVPEELSCRGEPEYICIRVAEAFCGSSKLGNREQTDKACLNGAEGLKTAARAGGAPVILRLILLILRCVLLSHTKNEESCGLAAEQQGPSRIPKWEGDLLYMPACSTLVSHSAAHKPGRP